MFASGVGTGAEAEAGPSFDTPMGGVTQLSHHRGDSVPAAGG